MGLKLAGSSRGSRLLWREDNACAPRSGHTSRSSLKLKRAVTTVLLPLHGLLVPTVSCRLGDVGENAIHARRLPSELAHRRPPPSH
jgi:hypothetical protein